MVPDRLRGIVKWFDEKKGYGYITVAQDGEAKDYFVHWSAIQSNHKFKKLKPNWVVEFTPDKNEKGDFAINVVLISVGESH